MVGLKMNVPKENLDGVVGLLPSLNAPTVAGLISRSVFGGIGGVRRGVRSLIPKLLKQARRYCRIFAQQSALEKKIRWALRTVQKLTH